MKMNKKVLAIIMSVFMIMSLVACGGGNSEADKSDIPETTSVEVSSTDSIDNESEEITEENKSTGDEIAIEEIYCSEVKSTYLNYELKVRNKLDVDVDGIRIQCKLIDESGDAIDSFEWLFTDIDAGTAEQAQHQINDNNGYRLEDAYAFKIYSFEVVNYEPWETLAEAEFEDPIIFVLDEIPEK